MPEAKTVFLATRPWSFPMTLLIVFSAIATAPLLGRKVDWLLAAIAAVGSVLLHAMANVVNDYFDARKGIDVPGTGTVEYRPHPVVHHILTPMGTLALGFGFGLAGVLLASAAAVMGRPYALPLGVLGLITAYVYTGPPLPLKYVALGEMGVFIAWGVLMPVGSYYLATGELTLYPILPAFPVSILVVDVLLANNIRDIEADRRAGIRTLAGIMGYGAASRLYHLLIYLAYAAALALALVNPCLIAGGLLPLLDYREARSVASMFEGGRAPPDADPRTARFLWRFTLLYAAGLILGVAAALAF